MMTRKWLIAAVLLAVLSGAGAYAAFQAQLRRVVRPLAAYAPPDALLAIEAPDFAALLKMWTDSAEQKRWLASDNYAGFLRSRLFERLGQAQDEFGATAGLEADTRFLQQIAGKNSLLAWYDIGNLEFLYITRLPDGQAARTPLLGLRDKFEQRKVGDAVFYVRTQGDPARTVAFAVRGDYLLLATREDLLAGSLQLMQKALAQETDRTLEHERWYTATVAAAARAPGDLRMTLNMAKIVPSPYFRTYWIQQNITELKQYTAALSDLYRTPDAIREERVLLAADSGREAVSADLSSVLSFVPGGVGVFRAMARPALDDVLEQMEDKLLSRRAGAYRDPFAMPTADVSTPSAGGAEELERRIDEPLVIAPARADELRGLREALSASPPEAMMVFSTASEAAGASQAVLHPVRTAVALAFEQPMETVSLQKGLTAALAARLSVGSAGLVWTPRGTGATATFKVSGEAALSMACRANVCVVASDEDTLQTLLKAADGRPGAKAVTATVVAGFQHGAEREAFYALARTLDHGAKPAESTPEQPAAPAFLSGNAVSLSKTFEALDSESFSENAAGNGVVRQSVTYRWRQ